MLSCLVILGLFCVHRPTGEVIMICFVILSVLGLSRFSAAQTACSATTPCAFTGGLNFIQPAEKSSQNGFLSTSLHVGISDFTLDWLTTQRRLYNGSFPGPTLRIKAGDRAQLDLVNNLEEPDFTDAPSGSLRFPNTTNIHTHGLHISSQTPQDNVLTRVGPGQTFSYNYGIHEQQAAGTYWYHPHLHGSVFFQNLGGMAGMLIVEDDPQSMSAELDSASCPNNCDKDIPMVFQLFQYSTADDGSYSSTQRDINDNEAFRLNNIMVENSTQSLEQWLEDPTNNIQHVLANGQLQPKLTIQPGQMMRFRLLNAGGIYALALHITRADGTGSPCSVKEIALDGHYLDKPRDQRLGRSLIVAAGRVDWLVVCEQAGEYQLRSTFTSDDHVSMGEHPSFGGLLLTIDVQGNSASNAGFPTSLPGRPEFEDDLRDVSADDICGKFALEVTPTDTLNREDFNSNVIRYKTEVGNIEEWHLTNTEYVTSHPIHIHVNAFQVVSYNQYVGPVGVDNGADHWKLFSQNNQTCTWQHSNFNSSVAIEVPPDMLGNLGHESRQQTGGAGTIGYAQIGEWRDTILVPPLANITVRFHTDSFVGKVVAHCHLLADADQGMSMFTEIVEKGGNLDAEPTSAGAYQGSCMDNNPVDVKCGAPGYWKRWKEAYP